MDQQEVDELAGQLSAVKSERLAWNDALVAMAVYGRRQRRGETSRVTEFGWGTWWLTGETAILRMTREIVKRHRARYVMRPEFLLNYLTLAPSAREARKAFANVFPSMLGIQLARRMKAEAFANVMDRVREADQLDEARRTVEIAKLSNQLKSDMTRGYTRIAARAPAPADAVAERDAALT